MPAYERFGRFLFGVLLIGSCFISWGRWIALGLGVLFLVSSAQGLCVSCKCKQAINNINQNKEKKQ